MSAMVDEVREKLHVLEGALRGAGYDMRSISPCNPATIQDGTTKTGTSGTS